MLRPISLAIPQRTERVSEVTRGQQTREDFKPRRVKEVSQPDKRAKKYPRLFRVERKPLTFQQQGQFAKQLNSYQLKALRNWQGFSDSLLDIESLNDAQRWILNAARVCEHLYPRALRKLLKKHIDEFQLTEDMNVDSQTVQQLLAYEHNLDGLLSILVLCRRYDKRKSAKRKSDEQELDNNGYK